MKNTALDWLKEEIFLEHNVYGREELRSGYQSDYDFTQEYIEGKKLEKQQIIDAFNAGLNSENMDGKTYYIKTFENK